MAGPVTLTCPRCRRVFPVPTEVLRVDGNEVIVRMDRSELYGHDCGETAADVPGVALQAWQPPTSVPQAELAGRIHRMLETGAFIATAGSRACTMCGTTGQECLDGLQGDGPRAACCSPCRDGNTHPAPGEAQGTCRQWSEAREANAPD